VCERQARVGFKDMGSGACDTKVIFAYFQSKSAFFSMLR
jgi:hypothetical protein